MNELFLELQPALFSIAVTVITAIASWLGLKAKELIDTQIKRSIVEDTVLYVEQIAKHFDSEVKFNLAKEKAMDWLHTKGIKVSEKELEIMIESVVQSFFAHYNEEEKK